MAAATSGRFKKVDSADVGRTNHGVLAVGREDDPSLGRRHGVRATPKTIENEVSGVIRGRDCVACATQSDGRVAATSPWRDCALNAPQLRRCVVEIHAGNVSAAHRDGLLRGAEEKPVLLGVTVYE